MGATTECPPQGGRAARGAATWLWAQDWTFQEVPGDLNLFLVPVLGQDEMGQRPEGKQGGSREGSGRRAVRIGTGSRGGELCPDGALGLGFMKGGLALCAWVSGIVGARRLTVVRVPGPAEAPEPPAAQPERGLVVLAQGGAVPQGEGGVLGTPVGDEAVLLASAGQDKGL